MEQPILVATKLRIPPQPGHGVPRARLVDPLERGLSNYRLVLVTAPAGYGKTTLLCQWAGASRFPVAWLSLSHEDNDLHRFFRYLLKGWAGIQPGILESPLGLLLSGREPDDQAVLTAFVNAASEAPDHLAFVLDDYHLIEDPAIHEGLAFLLDHAPPTLHVVLAGRAEPPLPVARYRARHQLLEFTAADLQFWPDEAADFLNERMGLHLLQEEIARLQAQTEGWIAGLQLAALSLQRHPAMADQLLVSGRQRFIADYLSEDVLAHLPEDAQRFLLQTSILDGLCQSLCDAVTGGKDGQAMLESLERANLFVIPLDERREWFRYHTLFADFLQDELRQRLSAEVPELHRQAARWYLAHELPEQSFHHAVAGDHVEEAIEVFEKYFNAKLNAGELNVVKRWTDSVPAAWYTAHPALSLMRAGLLAASGQFEACLGVVAEVEQRVLAADREESELQLPRVMAVHCFMACIQNDVQRAESCADRALRDLPDEDMSFRPGVYGALGDVYRRNGRWDEAKACYLKSLELAQAPLVRLHATHVFGALADLELRQGRLLKAAAYWRQALAAAQQPENWGRVELPLIGWIYIRMGELFYEWNQLAEAGDHAARGLERAELGGDPQTMIAGYLLSGRLKLAAGDLAGADEVLEKLRPLIESSPFPDWTGRFGRFQLECWLAQDRLSEAVNWADELLLDEAFKGPLESEEAQLAMARVLIVKGDGPSIGRALALLRRLLQTVEVEGRAGLIIEALAFQALAHWRGGDPVNALAALERALRLAQPEGYVRLFADLGPPMGRLLQEARSRAVLPEYVARLLAAFGPDQSVRAPAAGASLQPAHALPEPLTEREEEVLQLLAAGLTNREIAAQLVVSPETVKKHNSSIYGKLGVSSRTAAAARARELKLLH